MKVSVTEATLASEAAKDAAPAEEEGEEAEDVEVEVTAEEAD